MEQNYIVFYSKKCKYSEDFLNQLHRNNIDLYKKFKHVNIDNGIKLPKFITMVPTIIIPSNNGKNTIFAGNDVFKWLDLISQQKVDQQSKPNINEFDPYSMGD